jgi:hypothetical protein
MTSRYGGLFQIDNLSDAGTALLLERVRLSGNKASTGYDESWLQRLIASHPQVLPIGEIESFLAGAVPVCLELNTNAGPIDLLLVSPRGDIVIVECKLWRNPQARREVVGQIIDYAKELPRLTYQAFEAAVLKAEPVSEAAKADSLYIRAGAEAGDVDEASFVNAVSRNLRRGRFLLLIVGDGIQEGVESIAEFLQQHAGMHFTLALVEVAIFKLPTSGYLVQPRVVAKTQMVPRGVVSIDDDRVSIRPDVATLVEQGSAQNSGMQRVRSAVSPTISEARLYEEVEAKLPGAAAELRQFVAALEEKGARPRFTSTTIVLQGNAGGSTLALARIDVASATAWFDDVASQASALGRRDAAIAYYQALVALVRDEALRTKKIKPATKSGIASLPLSDLLLRRREWLQAASEYLGSLSEAAGAG